MKKSTQGAQRRFERRREGMEPVVCESAAGRGADCAPALATLPRYSSPDGGPMGTWQAAAAAPFRESSHRPMVAGRAA